MGDTTDPQLHLQQLHRRWERITEVPVVPRSTMDVIEFGLGEHRRAEVFLNWVLCYLLFSCPAIGLATYGL